VTQFWFLISLLVPFPLNLHVFMRIRLQMETGTTAFFE